MSAPTALWWFRRDLRVRDQPDLAALVADGARVIGVVVRDPRDRVVSPRRADVFDAAVSGLRDTIASGGGRLGVLDGHAEDVLPALAQRVGATHCFAQEEVTPRGQARDRRVSGALEAIGVEWHQVGVPDAVPPGVVRTGRGGTYKIFTPYHRGWRTLPDVPSTPPVSLADPGVAVENGAIDAAALTEAEAHDQITRFVARGAYDAERDRLDGAGGSGLAAALRFGLLSAATARRIAHEAGLDGWTRQLAWRDFAYESVRAWPELLERSVRERTWSRDERAFEEWRRGATGVRPVDAAMRQLNATGELSNRARMLVASFLTKDLELDWRLGARAFLEELRDGDPAINALNWQWVASTGFDAMPPYRRLAPERQAERFDPDGSWQQRWLAEGA